MGGVLGAVNAQELTHRCHQAWLRKRGKIECPWGQGQSFFRRPGTVEGFQLWNNPCVLRFSNWSIFIKFDHEGINS